MLSWKSHGINEFIVQAMSLVKEANTILTGLKSNVKTIEDCLAKMEEDVMFERRDGKTYALEDFQGVHEARHFRDERQ